MEQKINLDRLEQAEELFGSFDENIRLIEKEFGVALVVPGLRAENRRRGSRGGG